MRKEVPRFATVSSDARDEVAQIKSRRRIALYSWLIVAVVVGSTLLGAVMPKSAVGTKENGTDMTAFYAAGMIVRDGRGVDLYDSDVQFEYEQPYLDEEAKALPFSYPPHVAVLFVPLTFVPFQVALLLHGVLMVLAMAVALKLMQPMVPVVRRHYALSLSFVLWFVPFTMSIGMGQNIGLTFLLLTWIWRSLTDGDQRSTGIAVTLMMFKPQFAVPISGLLLVGRHYRAVGVAALGTSLIGVLNIFIFSLSWPVRWFGTFSDFTSANEFTETVRFVVSPTGFLRAVLGTDSSVAPVAGMVVIVAVASVMTWLWRQPGASIDLLMAATAPAIILTSLHSMAFSPTLLLVTAAVVAGRGRLSWPLVLAIHVSGWIVISLLPLGFNLAAPATLVTFVISAVIAQRSIAGPSPDAADVDESVFTDPSSTTSPAFL